jgi:hypothetical protein
MSIGMSNPNSDGLKIIRERIFIEHSSPEEREIIDEYTILNETTEKIRSIFIPRTDFMIGLKILDSKNQELSFLTNEHTRELLDTDKMLYSTALMENRLLTQVNLRQIFIIWIRLHLDEPINPNEPKIIKLVYKNTTPTKKIGFFNSLQRQKFLFSIPRFRTQNTKDESQKYDIFYIISAPEGFELDYQIIKNIKIENGEEKPLEKKDGVHTNYNNEILSIRTPGLFNKTEFDLIYEVIPKLNERIFYLITVFSLISLSAFFVFLNLKYIVNTFNLLPNLVTHSNTVFGGIITASLAAIGFLRNSSTIRTRFWFLCPTIISAIGFLIKSV